MLNEEKIFYNTNGLRRREICHLLFQLYHLYYKIKTYSKKTKDDNYLSSFISIYLGVKEGRKENIAFFLFLVF